MPDPVDALDAPTVAIPKHDGDAGSFDDLLRAETAGEPEPAPIVEEAQAVVARDLPGMLLPAEAPLPVAAPPAPAAPAPGTLLPAEG